MKNIKIIIVAIIALVVGLGIGFFIFGNKNNIATPADHQHNHTITNAVDSGKEQIWTCSMHPQIRQNEPGDCPICGMDLIPLEENSSSDPLVLQMTNEAVKLANIQTTIIGEAEGQSGKTIRLSGKVQADERLASSQVAHVPGRIEKLFVTFTGEQVAKGQKLAEIYSPDLITAQRELLEALKLQSLHPNLVEAARNKLRFWKISNNVITDIEMSGKVKETFTIFAAASGIVTHRRVSVGDYIKQGEPLFDLMNLRKVWVLFDAYEEDLATIKVGNRIEFTTPSIPNRTFKTRVTFIDPIINPNTRVASVRTEVNNTSGQLKPEMFVNGVLKNNTLTKSKTQLAVPKTAVMWTGKRSVVYVKIPDMDIPSFQFREVELGARLGDFYQVSKGLEVGEEVVTYGSFTIDAAAQLNNQASMMNKNVNVKKDATAGRVPNFQPETPTAFKEQLNVLTNQYIHLKDAFVATDASTAASAAQKVLTQLDKIDMKLVEGDAHLFWMEQLNAIQSHTQKITELTEIEAQRKQFGFLSDALIKSIDAFGITGDSLYVQYCPMAFNNHGGNWISTMEQIQNPYFGDKMMKCGVVKKEFAERKESMKSKPNQPIKGHNH